MSIDSARSFILRMRSDSDFASNVGSFIDAESQLSFLSAAGYNFTLEEFTSEMMNHDNHITDDELHFSARLVNKYVPVRE
jgi:predicted ribosomally synthesized peptide with nif11-like leader